MAFGGRCGTKLASLWPACGFVNLAGFAFCGKCGARVAQAPAPALQGSPAFASPRSYTPKHLAEKILALEGSPRGRAQAGDGALRRPQALHGVTADRDPEEARKILDPVLERMMDAVHHYEGTVNQVMGDGVMALFGAPLAHEGHAVRACYAALTMHEAVRRYANELRRGQGPALHRPAPAARGGNGGLHPAPAERALRASARGTGRVGRSLRAHG